MRASHALVLGVAPLDRCSGAVLSVAPHCVRRAGIVWRLGRIAQRHGPRFLRTVLGIAQLAPPVTESVSSVSFPSHSHFPAISGTGRRGPSRTQVHGIAQLARP
eukprot:13937686-Alexandrium_andersonii.AAC.1